MNPLMDELARSLGRIEGKLDSLLALHADHEVRLRTLERSRYWLMGVASVAGAISASLLTLLKGAFQ